MKEIKRADHFVLLMIVSLCEVSLFCIFLLLTLSFFYLFLDVSFLEISLVRDVSDFYVILRFLPYFILMKSDFSNGQDICLARHLFIVWS